MGKVRSAVQCSRKSKRKHCLTAKQKRYLKLNAGPGFWNEPGSLRGIVPGAFGLKRGN